MEALGGSPRVPTNANPVKLVSRNEWFDGPGDLGLRDEIIIYKRAASHEREARSDSSIRVDSRRE